VENIGGYVILCYVAFCNYDLGRFVYRVECLSQFCEERFFYVVVLKISERNRIANICVKENKHAAWDVNDALEILRLENRAGIGRVIIQVVFESEHG
jgi:hypothetical protein